jgi:hypothetical protein
MGSGGVSHRREKSLPTSFRLVSKGAMPNRLAGENQPLPVAARQQPGRLVSVGRRGLRKAREGTGRSSSPSATRRATGATSWSTSRSRTPTSPPSHERFVSVKVDREERPDVDRVYMTFSPGPDRVGRLAHDRVPHAGRQPFYGGTYFPPEPRHGLPSFRQVLSVVGADAYHTRRDEVAESAAGLRDALEQSTRLRAPAAAVACPSSTARTAGWPAATIRSTAGSARRRSSRSRWHWSSCCGTTRAPATSSRCACCATRCGRWRTAACTTISVAGSIATAWTAMAGAALREDAVRQRARGRAGQR